MDKKIYSGVIVKHNDKCLLCKRNSTGSFPGMWSIPGGKNEEGEETMEAAKREFFEETAHDITDEKLKFVGVMPRYTRDGKKIKGMMFAYKLEVENPIIPDLEKAIDGSEHTECKYFDIDQIRKEEVGTVLYETLKSIFEK